MQRADWKESLSKVESPLTKNEHSQIKLNYEESWLTTIVDWWRKLIDQESWLTKKVDCFFCYSTIQTMELINDSSDSKFLSDSKLQ